MYYASFSPKTPPRRTAGMGVRGSRNTIGQTNDDGSDCGMRGDMVNEFAARESVRCAHDLMRACGNVRKSPAKVKFLKKGVFGGENALH